MLAIIAAACSPALPSRGPGATAAPTPEATAVAAVAPALAARLGTELDAGLVALGSPGVQAAIVFADGSTWVGASGTSTDDQPMTPGLLMALASVTKVYTAGLVLRLADYGVLGLDDLATRWVPDAVNADGVTIRQLLTHTSGIASDDPAFPPVCAPGTCYSYSNSGYGLLGRVIEAATGQRYAASLRARFLAPLGLRSTFYPREEPTVGESAMGHLDDERVAAIDAATAPEGPGWRGASGGLVATAEDTARFFHALLTGGPLSGAGRNALTDLELTLGLPGTTECHAAAMLGRDGGPYGESWSHGGNAGSFRSWVAHYPAHRLTIAVLLNSVAFPRSIADRLVATALEGSPAAPDSGHCEDAIAVRSAAGTTVRFPDAASFNGMPAWSPDGQSIAWLTYRDDQVDILVALANGSGVLHLTDDPPNDLRVAWSPDGERVVYSSDVDGDHELYVLRLADGSITKLTDNDIDDWVPAWSPDGASIAYIRTDDRGQLRVMAVDGSGDLEVGGATGNPWWPAWSPDGTRIAYETDGAIFIVPAEGGQAVRLTVEQLRVVRFPAWAPGKDLLFSSDSDLYAAAADGSNVRRLTATPTEELTAAWAPDGATIAFQVSYWVPGAP
jgi:CubicO group peptidase (beta-lactamase class C family)